MSWLIYVVKISSKKCLAYWQQIHFRTSVLPRKSLIQVFLNFLQERERDCEFVAKIFFSHLDRNAWWMIWDVPRQCCCNQCSREQCGRPPVTPRCHWFPEPRQHESVPPGPVGYPWQHLWRQKKLKINKQANQVSKVECLQLDSNCLQMYLFLI